MTDRPNRPANPDRVGELLERVLGRPPTIDPRVDGAHDRVPLPADEAED